MARPLSLPRAVDVDAASAIAARVLVCALPVLFLTGKAPPDIAVSLVAALFLVRSAWARDWAWLRTPWVAAAGAVWLYLMAASVAAVDVAGALGRAVPWVRLIVFAAALQVWVLADPAWRRRLTIATGVVLGFVALDTLYQFYAGVDVFGIERYSATRMTGPMPELPPKVGTYVMRLMFPVLLAVAVWAATRGTAAARAGALAAVGLGFVAVLVSGERMPLLLAGFGYAVAVAIVPAARRLLLAAGVAAGLLIGAFAAVDDTVFRRSVQSTVETIDEFSHSHYARIWGSTLAVWADHPVFGVGLKSFRAVCADAAYGQTEDVVARCASHPHNVYLEWLAEAGLVGFAGFLALIALWARHAVAAARRALPRPWESGTVVAAVTFFWPLASTMSFFTNWHAALFWLVLGWALAATTPPRPGGAAP